MDLPAENTTTPEQVRIHSRIFLSLQELLTQKFTLISLSGAIIGIIAIFIPWIVIDLSLLKGNIITAQIPLAINSSFSLADIDKLIAFLSTYTSIIGYHLNGNHWIYLFIICILAVATSFFAEVKIRGIAHLILVLITIAALFWFYQEIQSLVYSINSLQNIMNPVMNVLSNFTGLKSIVTLGYGLYLEVIGLLLLLIGTVFELKEGFCK
jgi:hypothetical protein